jgi:TctA family transporter
MYRFGFSPAAASLAVVLSRGFESSLRYGLALSDDSFWRLVTRPVTATILLVSLAMLVAGLIREVHSRRQEQIEMQAAISAEVEGIDQPPKVPDAQT